MISFSLLAILVICASLAGIRAHAIGAPLRSTPGEEIYPELVEYHRSRLALLVLLFAAAPALALPFLADFSTLTPARQAAFFLFIFLDIMLIALAVTVGNFATRRAVFNDGRSLATYVQFTLRLVIAFAGFWIVLLIAPFLLHRTGVGASGWLIAGSLCLLLLAWSRNFAGIFCYLLDARPLDDERLGKRLDDVIGKSGIDRVEIYESGPWNGGWCNAAALPSVNTPRVVLSHPLVELLDSEEIAAIFAHELGHLEEFKSGAFGKLRRRELILVALACFLEPALVAIDPALGSWGFWAWLPIVAALLAWRIKDSQRREIASDRRAVDLSGNPEALISGLVKVYHASKLPRRMAIRAERHSSHPSLARRIQDIRRYAEATRQHSGEASDAVVVSKGIENWTSIFISRKNVGHMLIMEPNRITWLEFPSRQIPEPPCSDSWTETSLEALKQVALRHRTLKYNELSELRLVVMQDGGKLSVAGLTEPAISGLKRFFVRDEDLPDMREALDRVDTRLGPLPARARSGHAILRFASAATTICALLATFEGIVTFGAGLWLIGAGLAALATGTRPWVAVLGAMASWTVLAQTSLSWDKTTWSADGCILLSMLLLAGCYLLHRVFPTSKSLEEILPPDQSPAFPAALLAALAALFAFLHLFGMQSHELHARLYAFALNSPGSFLPLVGAAAALMTCRRSLARILAAFIGLIGVSHAWLGSQHFLENYSRDPMVSDVPAFAPLALDYEERCRVRLEGSHRDLILSPAGMHFATVTGDEPLRSPLARVYQVSDWSGEGERLEALGLHFLDDNTLLTLFPWGENEVQIQLRDLRSLDQVVWQKPLPGLPADGLFSIAGKGSKWRVTVNPNEFITMRLSGVIRSDLLEMHTWSQYTPGNHWRYVGSGERCLQVVRGGHTRRGAAASRDRLAWMFQRYWRRNELQWLGTNGTESSATTILSIEAAEPAFGEAEMMIFAYGPSSGWVCSADSLTGEITTLAAIEPNYATAWDGTHLAILHLEQLLVTNRDTGLTLGLPLTRKSSWNTSLALGSTTLAISWADDGHTDVALIDLNGLDAPRSSRLRAPSKNESPQREDPPMANRIVPAPGERTRS